VAKKSSVERNNKRARLAKRFAGKRNRLRELANDRSQPQEERFKARQALAQLPRNSSPTRVRLRCEITGRSRGNYRKFRICRNMLREMASNGEIPGMVKSSW
jgi:small subunit ribosomal protein S14